jgi:murein DD-endopeptidase MepM/ murein hydrolase activator NlpD
MVVPPAKARGTNGLPALCGPRTVPEGDVCIPLPPPGREDDVAPAAAPQANAHPRLHGGGVESYEQIPKLPDRPADWGAYALPVGEPGKAPKVASGYDLDLPAADQRHGPGFKAYGHGGVDLGAERGAPVKAIRLEHQEGDAEVVFIGELFGLTVVTSHAVRERDKLKTVLLFHGHLERAAPGLAPHGRVVEGAAIGAVGDSGSPGIVHLHLEARQVRDGVNLGGVDPKKLVDQGVSIATDPRNVLVVR